MITFQKKSDYFPQKSEYYHSTSTHFPQNKFSTPNMLIYALFIDFRESYLRTFSRQIHQGAKIRGDVKPILAMPRFWERLLCQPLPYRAMSIDSVGINTFDPGNDEGMKNTLILIWWQIWKKWFKMQCPDQWPLMIKY